MTGREGVKEFLRMAYESANYFDVQVAKAAGLNISTGPEMDSVETAFKTVDRLNQRFARAAGSS